MDQNQVLSFLIQESQKQIDDFGIDLNFEQVINEIVRYKTPFNLIKVILRFVWWNDKAGVYDYMKIHHPRAFTVQELVEFLKQEDPNAHVMVGGIKTAIPMVNEPIAMFVKKSGSKNKLFFEEDFDKNIKDKMQPVVVIDIEKTT